MLQSRLDWRPPWTIAGCTARSQRRQKPEEVRLVFQHPVIGRSHRRKIQEDHELQRLRRCSRGFELAVQQQSNIRQDSAQLRRAKGIAAASSSLPINFDFGYFAAARPAMLNGRTWPLAGSWLSFNQQS